MQWQTLPAAGRATGRRRTWLAGVGSGCGSDRVARRAVGDFGLRLSRQRLRDHPILPPPPRALGAETLANLHLFQRLGICG